MKVLSIIIPCYNEQDNILIILDKISKVLLPFNIQKEIIIVDDYSTDNTRNILKILDSSIYSIYLQDQNYGK
jgi:glycosyltransferase involved in cell wall biosynthesis